MEKLKDALRRRYNDYGDEQIIPLMIVLVIGIMIISAALSFVPDNIPILNIVTGVVGVLIIVALLDMLTASVVMTARLVRDRQQERRKNSA
jgi:FtsH-binding integral membrane protein